MAARLQSPSADSSVGTLLGHAAQDVASLVRKEVELAKLELTEEVRTATDTAKMFGVAAFLGWMTAFLAAFAVAWGLAEVMPTGVAFAIVAFVCGIGAAIAFVNGRAKAQAMRPMPEETVETLKEDVQWLKSRKTAR